MSTSYRLPDWLGGHDCQIATEHADDWVTVEALGRLPMDSGQVMVNLRRDLLVVVKPPSIDDPEPLPFTASDGGGHWIRLDDEGGDRLTTLRVGYSNKDWHYDLEPYELRRLSRAAWQRANAIEAGS